MMNCGSHAPCGSHKRKENIQPSIKPEAQLLQRNKQRTVLGVLSENEQRSRSRGQASQFPKHSSISDSSQLTLLSCPSSSSFDVYVEEACEVVLAASGQEVVSDGYGLDAESAALQNEDVRLLLELSSSPCQGASQQSDMDRSLMSEEVLCVSQYVEDIHRNLRESETRLSPQPGYLDRHPEITNKMRVILVDWLVEVVQEYQLRSETLHLAVNYMDRFLSSTACVRRGKLQLTLMCAFKPKDVDRSQLKTRLMTGEKPRVDHVGKYEEISPPELCEFVYTTDSTYTKKQLVQIEHIFLQVLSFKMAAPTINQFLRLFMTVQHVCANTENIALYVAELSLLEVDPFLKFTPSLVAAAAYCLAAYTVNRTLWPESLKAFTGYTVAEIQPCLVELHKLHISAESRPHQAIREKYKSSKYCHVSLITPPAVLPFS